jgi:hypothetical protein
MFFKTITVASPAPAYLTKRLLEVLSAKERNIKTLAQMQFNFTFFSAVRKYFFKSMQTLLKLLKFYKTTAKNNYINDTFCCSNSP